MNLEINMYQGNIKGNLWQVVVQGVTAFGTGAVAGTLALYGLAGWSGGKAIVGGTNA